MRSTLLLPVLFDLSSAVKVTVNNNRPVKKVLQNTDDDVFLTCKFEAHNRDAYARACSKEPSYCSYVTWEARGLEGIDQWITIARLNKPIQPVLPDYTDKFAKANTNDLRLANTVTQSAYNATYRCRVEIDTDSPNRDEAQFDLYILVPPSKPMLAGNQQPVLDKSTKLNCASSRGSPEPTYKWFKDGVEIDFNKILEFTAPEVRSSGASSATDENDDPSSESAPKSAEEVVTYDDQKIALKSVPQMKYELADNSKTLVINQVAGDDRGSYTCQAYNEAIDPSVTKVANTVIESDPLLLQPQAIDILLWGSVGAGAVLLVLVLISIYCCCRAYRKKEQVPPGAVLRDENFTSGRLAVTPTKSAHTHMTNASAAGYSYGHQVSDYGVNQQFVDAYRGQQQNFNPNGQIIPNYSNDNTLRTGYDKQVGYDQDFEASTLNNQQQAQQQQNLAYAQKHGYGQQYQSGY